MDYERYFTRKTQTKRYAAAVFATIATAIVSLGACALLEDLLLSEPNANAAKSIDPRIDGNCSATSLKDVPFIDHDELNIFHQQRRINVQITDRVLTSNIDTGDLKLVFRYAAQDAQHSDSWTDSYASSVCAAPYAVTLKSAKFLTPTPAG